MNEQKTKLGQTSIVENDKVTNFIEKFVGLTLSIKERLLLEEVDNKDIEANKTQTKQNIFTFPICIFTYVCFFIFTIVSLINSRSTGKDYFSNLSLLNIFSNENSKEWTVKSKILPNLIEMFSPFFLDDLGKKSKLGEKLTFISNVNINFYTVKIVHCANDFLEFQKLASYNIKISYLSL